MEDYNNYIFWFGCPPGGAMGASTTLSAGFFNEIKRAASAKGGKVVLPMDLMMWSPGDDGEMV